MYASICVISLPRVIQTDLRVYDHDSRLLLDTTSSILCSLRLYSSCLTSELRNCFYQNFLAVEYVEGHCLFSHLSFECVFHA